LGDLSLEKTGVFATGAGAVFSTYFTCAETFAIHFKTKGFLTVASYFFFLGGIGEGLCM
jgi:hypothetical protein